MLFVAALSSNAVAGLSTEDSTSLTYHLEQVSAGWLQPSVDTCNMILSDIHYDYEDYNLFFTDYFQNHHFTDDLSNYLWYPVFGWFDEQVHDNLQKALFPVFTDMMNGIMMTHLVELGTILENDVGIRQDLVNGHRFMFSYYRWGEIDSLKSETYDFYLNHVLSYPSVFYKPNTIDTAAMPYVGWIKAQAFFNLVQSLPLTTQLKTEIANAIGLDSIYLDIWNNHSLVIIDNNGISERGLNQIRSYLSLIPQELLNLKGITVNDFLGNTGSRYLWMNTYYGINIFGGEIGLYPENSFPDDIEPVYSEFFSMVLAHESNHVVDAFYICNDSILNKRKEDLIQAAGSDSLNYLRSMFADGIFQSAPQEFFASISNEWFTDSRHTIRLGINRFLNEIPHPINQALFFAEVYSLYGDTTLFFKIDSTGAIMREKVLLGRDENYHINKLYFNDSTYSFILDSEGNVISIELSCCAGTVGNVNCSEEDNPDISDITRLIDFLYLSHDPLCCTEEADANASDGEPDISDITRLIDFLYLSHDPLADCP